MEFIKKITHTIRVKIILRYLHLISKNKQALTASTIYLLLQDVHVQWFNER